MWLRVVKRDAGKGASEWPARSWERGRQGKVEGGREGGGGCQPTSWGGGAAQGNNEAFGDCAGSTPSFPVCPLCGLDPGGCLGVGQGALNGPLVSALGVGQASRAHSALARLGQPLWLPPPAG